MGIPSCMLWISWVRLIHHYFYRLDSLTFLPIACGHLSSISSSIRYHHVNSLLRVSELIPSLLYPFTNGTDVGYGVLPDTHRASQLRGRFPLINSQDVSLGFCSFFVYLRPAKNTKKYAVT
jgi:hypothetical protein